MTYLVAGSHGPGFASRDEAMRILEQLVLPTFDMLMKLQAEKKILAGGLPVGERAFVFIVEAGSHDEVDRMLRGLPMWGVLEWKVTPLEGIAARAEQERAVVAAMRK